MEPADPALRRRLEHYCVPHQECRCQLACGKIDGVIKRSDSNNNSQRHALNQCNSSFVIPRKVIAVEGFPFNSLRFIGKIVDEVGSTDDFTFCFVMAFAYLADK